MVKSGLLLLSLSGLLCVAGAAERPNVLWISSEDNGPHLGCYGDKYATTPNLDALAARGLRFTNVWSVAPVCAPARTALITGLYPSSSGAIHMRSMVPLPDGFRLLPQYLRDAGLYCTNNSKEDYNVRPQGKVWDESSARAHWRNRAAGQPFFAVFNFTVTHESQVRKRPHIPVHDPAAAPLPPYWPDAPEVRQDWAQYYDNITSMDRMAGGILAALEADALAQDTIIFYWGDHGPGLPRCKRTPCDSGLHVPLIVYFPEKWKHLAPAGYAAGAASGRLVSFVDFAPSMLSLYGLEPPAWMQGRAFAGKHAQAAREFLHGQRGRMDERYDMVRSVRDARYVYIKNYFPHRPAGQHNEYMFETPLTRVWHRLFTEGKTTPEQSAFWKPHPPEELYDLQSDPHEVRNLAGDPAHAGALARLRQAHLAHEREVRDIALLPEAEFLRRSGKDAPYQAARDEARFPLEDILRTAQLASSGRPGDLTPLAGELEARDAGVRWWAVMGHLTRGTEAVATSAERIAARLRDENPSVRILAAETLAKHGSGRDAAAALEILLASADAVRNDYYDAVWALNALDDLRPSLSAASRDRLRTLPRARPGQDGRTSDYTARLLKRFEP